MPDTTLNSLDRLLFIRRVPIFEELRDDFLMRLAPVMDEVHFEAGYTIITEGQEGRAMYIIVSGQVSVHLSGQQVAQFKAGDCFGEMSVFDAEPRSASVTTLESCDCLVLTQQQLYDAIDETPGIAVNIIRLLSRRIRELNQDLNLVKGRLKVAKADRAHPAPALSVPADAPDPYAHNGYPAKPSSPTGYPVPAWDRPIVY